MGARIPRREGALSGPHLSTPRLASSRYSQRCLQRAEAVYNVFRICRERTAERLNCYNYSYFVQLSLVKSRYYSVFLLPFCGENTAVQSCVEAMRPAASITAAVCRYCWDYNTAAAVVVVRSSVVRR